MTVSKDDSKLRILSIDTMVKKEADLESTPDEVTVEPVVGNPTTVKEDLPF
jgi:hypothetical protein